MPEIQLSDLKITKMTSEGWVTAPLSESSYYKSACAIQKQEYKKARDIFMDYIKDMFLYDERPKKIHEMSWSRFLDLNNFVKTCGMIQPRHNEIKIDTELMIHDGQHRLSIWYALGNENAKVEKFWDKKDIIKCRKKHYPIEAKERREQLKKEREIARNELKS